MNLNIYAASTGGEANVSIRRNRVKNYNGKVYLQDKQEFEIELFNPTQTTKLAKISINGKLISNSGLVLKPGSRVYLERYLDKAKKFLFETYEVDSNNPEVEKAIAKNGLIEVSFYDEKQQEPQYYHTHNLQSFPRTIYGSGTYDTSITASYFNSAGATLTTTPLKRSKETGRIEAGSASNQSFTNYSGEFNSWTSNVVIIKLLPYSEKPIEGVDLVVYCGNCGGKKRKKSDYFCSHCGTKF